MIKLLRTRYFFNGQFYGIMLLWVFVREDVKLVQVYGIDVIIRICSHLAFIYLTFWSLKALRLEVFFQSLQTPQIRTIILLLSISIGYTASNFFLELIVLSKNLFLSGI